MVVMFRLRPAPHNIPSYVGGELSTVLRPTGRINTLTSALRSLKTSTPAPPPAPLPQPLRLAVDMPFVNKRNPNTEPFFPLQEPAIGAAYPAVRSSRLEIPRVPDHDSLLPPVRFPPEQNPAQTFPTHNNQGLHLQEQGLDGRNVPVQR